MAFQQFQFDANGALLIGEVRSPNYVTGVSGWRLAEDGSAEFNTINIRSTDMQLTGASVLNVGSGNFSVQDLVYWTLGNLVYFNVRLVVSANGSGAVNIAVTMPFTFENTNSAGRTLSQVFPFTHSSLGGGYPVATGGGICVTAAGGITQFRGEGGTFIQGQHLIIGSQIVVQGVGVIT